MPIRLLKNTALILFLLTYCRLVFFLLNKSFFPSFDPAVFFFGLRFDVVSIAYLFSGFYLVLIIPFRNNENKWKRRLMAGFFQIGLHLTLLPNLIDAIYFNFTFKRTTGDVFAFAGTGNEIGRLIPQFLSDFWYVVLIYIGSAILFTRLYKRVNKISEPIILSHYKDWVKRAVGAVLFLGLLVVGARGGFQLRPLNMADAPRYAQGNDVAVLVNTPFSVLLTIQNPGAKKVKYFEKADLEKLYSPVQTIKASGKFVGRNVVVIILESFAEEYIGAVSTKEGYTPFLDSLFSKSYVFNNARANGLRSIDALPSLFGGLPALSNTSFILSPHSSNAIETMPQELKKLGYNTSFYHAGETGTMAFDAYCKNAKIDQYFGLEDYPNWKKDYDGSWGVYDEPYLKYFCKELSQKNQPFFSSVFTLSSHHPYSIPSKYKDVFPKGNLPVHETIGYTDNALRKFFDESKKQKWFENTIFVITADHPAQSEYAYYKTNSGRFKVPLVFYDPKGELVGVDSNLAKHADVPNTILGLVKEEDKEVFNFGNDLFDPAYDLSVNFRGSVYLIRNKDYVLVYDGEHVNHFYAANDTLWKNDLIQNKDFELTKDTLLILGKAYLQQYNNRIIENRLTVGK